MIVSCRPTNLPLKHFTADLEQHLLRDFLQKIGASKSRASLQKSHCNQSCRRPPKSIDILGIKTLVSQFSHQNSNHRRRQCCYHHKKHGCNDCLGIGNQVIKQPRIDPRDAFKPSFLPGIMSALEHRYGLLSGCFCLSGSVQRHFARPK